MLSFSCPAARAGRFGLPFNRETESWRCLVTGRRIHSMLEPEPGIKSRNPYAAWKCSQNTGFSRVLSGGRQLLIF